MCVASLWTQSLHYQDDRIVKDVKTVDLYSSHSIK